MHYGLHNHKKTISSLEMNHKHETTWKNLYQKDNMFYIVLVFQILKDDAVKVLHSICQQIWKTQQWPQDWKRSVFIPIPKKGNAKECSNFCTIALISQRNGQSNGQNSPSQASTVCELRNSRCSNWIQERHRNQRWNCQHILDNRKNKRVPEKCLLLIYWLYRIFGLNHSKLWKL